MEPFEAAWEVGQFLTQQGLPYALIGGLAVQVWGDARLTVDADISVAAPPGTGTAAFVRLITGRFLSRTTDPIAFAQATRIILVSAGNGVDVDISLALPGYVDDLFARSTCLTRARVAEKNRKLWAGTLLSNVPAHNFREFPACCAGRR